MTYLCLLMPSAVDYWCTIVDKRGHNDRDYRIEALNIVRGELQSQKLLVQPCMQILDQISQEDYPTPSDTLLTDQLSPWENNNSKIVTHSGELLGSYKCQKSADPNSIVPGYKKRKLKRSNYLKACPRPLVNIQPFGNNEDSLTTTSPRPTDIDRCEFINMSINMGKDELADKENSFRIRQSLAESKRYQRFEQVLKMTNPRRTQSILLDRSKLRSILKEELSQITETPRLKVCKPPQNIFAQKVNEKDYRKHGFTLHRYNKATPATRAQLKFIPEVVRHLYEKYSLNRTRTSFRNGRIV